MRCWDRRAHGGAGRRLRLLRRPRGPGRTVARVVRSPRGAGEAIDHVVLETSGLADPGPIVEAIRGDPILVHHILVTEIIVAVDALHGIAQLMREPLGRSRSRRRTG